MRHLKLVSLNARTSHFRSSLVPTPRELEVEDLLCRGYSQENIAAIFGRSVHTISVHTLSLYRKRGVHSQVELLLAYLERKGICVFPDDEGNRNSGQRASNLVLR
jgi:DNA-binding CsgD family transcriptional regulator